MFSAYSQDSGEGWKRSQMKTDVRGKGKECADGDGRCWGSKASWRMCWELPREAEMRAAILIQKLKKAQLNTTESEGKVKCK